MRTSEDPFGETLSNVVVSDFEGFKNKNGGSHSLKKQ